MTVLIPYDCDPTPLPPTHNNNNNTSALHNCTNVHKLQDCFAMQNCEGSPAPQTTTAAAATTTTATAPTYIPSSPTSSGKKRKLHWIRDSLYNKEGTALKQLSSKRHRCATDIEHSANAPLQDDCNNNNNSSRLSSSPKRSKTTTTSTLPEKKQVRFVSTVQTQEHPSSQQQQQQNFWSFAEDLWWSLSELRSFKESAKTSAIELAQTDLKYQSLVASIYKHCVHKTSGGGRGHQVQLADIKNYIRTSLEDPSRRGLERWTVPLVGQHSSVRSKKLHDAVKDAAASASASAAADDEIQRVSEWYSKAGADFARALATADEVAVRLERRMEENAKLNK